MNRIFQCTRWLRAVLSTILRCRLEFMIIYHQNVFLLPCVCANWLATTTTSFFKKREIKWNEDMKIVEGPALTPSTTDTPSGSSGSAISSTALCHAQVRVHYGKKKGKGRRKEGGNKSEWIYTKKRKKERRATSAATVFKTAMHCNVHVFTSNNDPNLSTVATHPTTHLPF